MGKSFQRTLFFGFSLFIVHYSLLIKQMVGLSGLEPPTSRLSGVRSNRLSYEPPSQGVSSPRLFSQPLSSLRSAPRPRSRVQRDESSRVKASLLVEMSGIEPLTPCLQGRCSPS